MQTDFIIVGQGLSGTWLSWWLLKAGKSFVVVDDNRPLSSSRIASGVINPVTGRVLAKTWLADTLLPFALETYREIGQDLGIKVVDTVEILHSFPTRQMQEAFEKRVPEMPEYLSIPADTRKWEAVLHPGFGYGLIHPALLIDLNLLLNRWQQKLSAVKMLRQEHFSSEELVLEGDTIRYKEYNARSIIFCDGIGSMDLPYFNRLPFAPNKGEALLLEIDGLPSHHIYKRGLSLVPFPHFNQLADPRYFWAGSTYQNKFADAQPTAAFRSKTEEQLRQWLKVPFRVVDHWAAVRPATLERRPFAGMHPLHPQVGLLNGMGTKGCSLAPWLAKQMAEHLVHGTAIQPEASMERFRRILSSR